MSVIAVTGHRPERLGDPIWVHDELTRLFKKLQPTLLYQGMAEGADLLAADVAYELQVPYVACRPWATHKVGEAAQAQYERVLSHAQKIVNVSEATRYEGPWLYHDRNKYMVDRAGIVVAIWDEAPKGGTAATVEYAKKLHRQVYVINPVKKTIRKLSDPMLF